MWYNPKITQENPNQINPESSQSLDFLSQEVEALRIRMEGVNRRALETGNTEELDRLNQELNQKLQEMEELYGSPDNIQVKTNVKYGPEDNIQEVEKNIEFDFEKQIERWTNFYTKYSIPTENFRETMEDIWERNEQEITKRIQEEGYDEILFIPPIQNLPDLHTKMSQGYNNTHLGSNFKNNGSFAGTITPDQNKAQIVLIRSNTLLSSPFS